MFNLNRKKATKKPSYSARTTSSRRSISTNTKKRSVVSTKRTSRAKKNNISKSISRHIKLSIFSFIAITLTVISLGIVIVMNYLNAPFTRASESLYFEQGVWSDKKDTINIAVIKIDEEIKDSKINKFVIFSIDKNEQKYKSYSLPLTEPIKLMSQNKERDVSLEDLYSFSNYNKIDFTEIVRDFFVNYLAIKIDGYIIVDDYGYEEISKVIDNIDYNDLAVNLRLRNTLKIPGLIFEFRSNAKTNLSMNDVFAILEFIKNTPKDNNRVHNVSKFELIDTNNWDILWQNNSGISEIKKEGIKVFVLNASDPKIPGLASWGTRLTKNLGTATLGNDNSFTDFDQNTIIAEDENLSTVVALREIFPESELVKPSELSVNGSYNPEIFRTKVTLVLVNY